MSVVDIILRYRTAFADGLRVTLFLASIAWAIGLLGGAVLGTLATRFPKLVGYPLRVISFALAAIPPIVLLYWAHYPLQATMQVVVDPFITAAATLSVLNTAVVAEITRSALLSFRREYKVAAYVSGMTRGETLRFIELPLIFRQALPALLASQVLVLQSTLFASLISVEELFRVAQRINATIYRPIQIYTALALFFLFVCGPVYLFAYVLRQRLVRDYSES